MFEKIDKDLLAKLSEKVRSNSDIFIKKYLRILKLNRMQFTKHKLSAGRNHAVHPSGTNKGRSRLARVMIPFRGMVAKGRPNTVGGPRGYHDRQEKILLKMNSKERKIAYTQMLINVLLYSKSYIVDDISLFNRKLIVNELKTHAGKKYNQKVDKTYRSFKRVATIVYEDNSIYKTYKNTCIDFFNLNAPQYLKLELVENSNHVILISKKTFKKIVDERI